MSIWQVWARWHMERKSGNLHESVVSFATHDSVIKLLLDDERFHDRTSSSEVEKYCTVGDTAACLPTIQDSNTDITIWEVSMLSKPRIVLLANCADEIAVRGHHIVSHRVKRQARKPEKYASIQWLMFQVSGKQLTLLYF